MRLVRGLALALAGVGLTVPAAHAAPPSNDTPAGAVEFTPYTAPNGTPIERAGEADLSEATPDPGVTRCLGPASFAHTVWFRVPPAAAPRLVRVEASGGELDTSETPDLALFVEPSDAGAGSPAPREPQACDGPAAGGAAGVVGGEGASAVEARIPAGRSVLVQAGRSQGQLSTHILLSLRAVEVEAVPEPAGDLAGTAPRQALGGLNTVALGGATLTEEDPAQPACPAAATVWRRFTATATGRHLATTTGAAAGTLTVFVGAVPDADNAVACENRAASNAAITTAFDARAGDSIWLRVGSDAPGRDASAPLGLAGPGQTPPGGGGSGSPGGGGGDGAGGTPRGRITVALLGTRSARRAMRKQTLSVRLRTTGRSFRSVRVAFQRRDRRGKYRTVARANPIASLATGRRTVRLRRVAGAQGRLRRGTYRVRLRARTTTRPSRSYTVLKRYRFGR